MGDSWEELVTVKSHISLPLLILEATEKFSTEVREKSPALLLIKLKDPAWMYSRTCNPLWHFAD